jgi:FAD synthetase
MKVMIFGTFDLLHKGHKFFIQEAKKLGDYLVIIIARNVTVEKLKGSPPQENEDIRHAKVSALGLSQHVVLGDISDHLRIIRVECPDIIALGYDQKHFATTLKEDLHKLGLTNTSIIRIGAYKPHIFKTSILRKKKIKAQD